MKSLKTLGLIFFICAFALVSCKKDIPANFDYGQIENNVYSNDFFNFNLEIPSEWFIQSVEEMKQYQDLGAEMMDDEETTKMIKAAQVRVANLFSFSQFDPKTHVDQSVMNANLGMVAENLAMTGVKSTMEYSNASRNGLENTGQVKLQSETADMKLGGKTFNYFDGVMNMGGFEMHQRYISTIINNFGINIVLTYGSEDQLEKLMGVIENIEFN